MLKKIIKKIPFAKKIIIFFYRKISFLKNYFFFLKNYLEFKKKEKNKFLKVKWTNRKPLLLEKTNSSYFDAHYIYHPAWAVRILAETNPKKHIDISSKMDFSTLLSAFIPVEFYDFRPADIKLDGLVCKFANLTDLHFDSNSIESLSCMHVVEHIGLGRYGDSIDPQGDLLGMKELERVLKPGGNLLFVVPVGKPKIEFNAHRVYSYNQIVSMFSKLKLKEFSLIPDDGVKRGIIHNASPDLVEKQDYGCGCFWFVK
jgi:SAM-dependent methyltransferase